MYSCPIPLCLLAASVLWAPVDLPAQTGDSTTSVEMAAIGESSILPVGITDDNFAALRERSPFFRTLDISGSLILTGIARIEDETVATLLDLETHTTHVVSKSGTNQDGWQLMEVKGDSSDLQSLTAKIKISGGAGIVSIRYEKSPPPVKVMNGVLVSTRIGNGTAGGGTNPHGGPDPRVLTPDQLADAQKAAREVRTGFKADGYGDNEAIPPDVVSKVSRLSVQQREGINVKMYEYRNRGLGMTERKKIYNSLLDQELKR